MKIASYNVENLFSRSAAFLDFAGKKADEEVLATYSQLTQLLAKPSYDGHQEEILTLLDKLGLKQVDENKTAVLRMERGHLLKRHTKDDTVEVVATGRSDWIGWIELRRTAVSSRATENTASIVAEVRPDVIAVVEVEDRMTLQRFEEYVLKKVTGHEKDPLRFEHAMLIDGNDERGIDVGVMARKGFEIESIRSHIDDKDGDSRIFSRDCVEYEVTTPGGGSLLLMVNHFKSKRGGGDARRKRQAEEVAKIYGKRRQEGHDRIVIAGDLNDTPDSKTLEPLLATTDLKDAGDHDEFDWGDGKGTYEDGDRIDYLLLSPALSKAVKRGGVNRRGIWKKSHLGDDTKMLPTLTEEKEAASDHAAIWVELDI